MNKHEDRNLAQLLRSDRELSQEEQEALRDLADQAWSDLRAELNSRAHNAYAIADPGDFATCVREHMDHDQRVEMTKADAFHCPGCGRHLKDRRTPLASSVLVERRRLRDLYLRIDRSPDGPTREQATRQFIAALGMA